MTTGSTERERLFHAAAVLEADQRAAFLAAACGEDAQLKSEVEALLTQDDAAGSFLERPAIRRDPSTIDQPSISEKPGSTVGPYKLLQVIGEGGMGVVYMAEQEQPVRRKVAVKIIKPGMDSKAVIARFEAERQALAMMDHANIAKVLDAGTTEKDLPYFVMELVQGVPITEYCDAHQLSPRERMELFVPICRAIQHAHQKGIIHRDIKPGNVLVTLYDDKPVPKVIDFGVAKAVETKLTEKTLFTQFGALVGTFEYMSPEQADMNALGVDTRSDVYSLGVLLYEMLTGTTPLQRSQLREAAYGEIVRRIKEEEPPKPSIRLSTSNALATVAGARRTEPAKLPTIVRGELDWIVMRCLEKDRKRRYDGANDLAKDVERYLADEQVEACPPTFSYQLRKTFRKHRGAILTASAIAAAFLIATVTSVWFALAAKQSQDQAVLAQELAQQKQVEAESARNEAEDAAAETEAISGFVVNSILAAADPNIEGSREIQLKEVLLRCSEKIDQQLTRPTLIQASIKLQLGRLLEDLNEKWQSMPGIQLIRESLKIRADLLGDDHPDTLDALEAEIKYGPWDSLDRRQRLYDLSRARFGDNHERTLRSKGELLFFVTWESRKDDGKLRELETEWEALRATQREILGKTHPDVLATEGRIALLYRLQGRSDLSVKKYEQVLEMHKQVLGLHHTSTLKSMAYLFDAYVKSGRYEHARKLVLEALEVGERMLSPHHEMNERFRERYFSVLFDIGRFDELEAFLKDEAAIGDARRYTAIQQLGVLHAWRRDYQACHTFCDELLDEYSQKADEYSQNEWSGFNSGVAKLLGRICLTNPHIAPEQLRKLSGLISSAWNNRGSTTMTEQRSRWLAIVYAMAEYRKQNFGKANDLLEGLFLADGTVGNTAGGRWLAVTYGYRAMCQEQLGNRDKAIALLAECKLWVEEKMASFHSHDPSTALIARMAYREAQELIAEGLKEDRVD